MEACASREELVAGFGDGLFDGVGVVLAEGVGGEVGSLREEEEPHGVEAAGAGHGAGVASLELREAVLEAGLVRDPFARHEDEAVEHHARAEDGDVFEVLAEDDVDVAVHAGGVRDPPLVQPVGVDLVVGDEDEAFGEGGLEAACGGDLEEVGHVVVPADADGRRAEPIGHRGQDNAEGLLCQRHVGVVVVFVDPV